MTDVENPRAGYCKKSVYHASGNWGSSYQRARSARTCSRKAKLDGYCGQHHPDSVKARDDASKAKWDAECAASKVRAFNEEKATRLRILRPILDELKKLAREYAISQPCRNPADIVDSISELVSEGLDPQVSDDSTDKNATREAKT